MNFVVSVVKSPVCRSRDDRPHLCDGCGTIHYQKPCIVAGTLPVSGSKVLLCKRDLLEKGTGRYRRGKR